MISIKAVSLNGQPLTPPTSAVFDERGGTLGRKDDCTLVLPDPERLISRHHAIIEYRGGQFIVRDQGTGTPVYVNRQALGNGRETALRAGDELRIGGYVLQVDAAQTQTKPAVSVPVDDPFAAFAITPPAASQPNPFSADTTSGGSAGKPFIPADFDPFADLKPTASVTAPDARPASELGSGMGVNSPSQSIDALFGLSGGGASSDPFGINTPTPSSQAHPSLSTDPLAAMGFTAAAKVDTTPVQRNDTPEIFGSFKLPEIKLEPLHLTEPTAAQPQQPSGVAAGQDSGSHASLADATGAFAAMSTEPHTLFQATPVTGDAHKPKDDPLALFGFEPTDAKAVNPLGIGEDDAAVSNKQQTGESVAATPELTSESTPTKSIPATPTHQEQGGAGETALRQAFLQGLGIPDLEIEGGITPEFMNLLGKLMREMTQGTLDLLLARSLTKREVRAEMTMIEVRENNPLKFSPTVEVALTHLLAPTMRGFLPPLKAVKGAYDDLRSHQLGFMAGVQGALNGVLERFNPEQLEKRLTEKSVIDSLLPMNRRAKLWDLFSDLYGDISKEAEDDFHALFGKEFVKAYEAQIAKLEDDELPAGK
ncbi:MAG TPA: type VI secretion system-associated FHA domain protein TagH [Pseudomonadales bacterium]|nr:type VI secretion system-associated FHA domain protein TagH [Pseudomonadales bacterium]